MKAAETDQTLSRQRALLVATVGFSLFYAVCVSFFYSTWLVGHAEEAVQSFDNVLNLAMLAAAALFFLLVRHWSDATQKACLLLGYVALAAGIIVLFFNTVTPLSPALVLFSAVCAGAGMSLTAPFFFASLASFSPKQTALGCGTMALVGMALDMAWSFAAPPLLLAVQLIALALSALCLKCSFQNFPSETMPEATASGPDPLTASGQRDFFNVFLVSIIGTFALSVVYGIIDTTAAGIGPSVKATAGISQVGGLAAALVFLGYFALAKRTSATFLFNLVFGLLASGMLLIPFLPNDYMVTLNIVAAAGWKLVMLSLFYLVVITYAHARTQLLAAMAMAYALPRFGLFIGLNVALLFNVGDGTDIARTTTVAFFLLYLIFMAVWFANTHERRRALKEMQAAYEELGRFTKESGDYRKNLAEELAAEHGLTNRESDILQLLAQGRDAAYISETLYLSRNTVKSYQKSIYAKLGVHSKQEIIELFTPKEAS